MGAIIVVDAFWGDSGKGKIAAYLAQRRGAAFCARAGTGTNAGHSVYFADGRQIRTHQLPCGLLDPRTQVRVGSGVAVDPERFLEELERLDPEYGLRERTRVDYRCAVIEPEHRQREGADPHLRDRVGSVGSGTGVARAEFVLRRARQARDLACLDGFTADVARELNEACAAGRTVVVEGSQGTHLSLALTPDYPCCTSDNCTAAALADDVGLSWRHIEEVVLVVKALPSRVGAGPLPLQLDEAEEEARGIVEHGVTTGRRRRKAGGISWPHLAESVMLNGPTQIALTFCDHLDPAVAGARDAAALTAPVRHLAARIEDQCGVPVRLFDCGKTFDCLVEAGS
ncbi:MAG: adenylosuccinate synthetase [Candidatus Latescibacterota bacterium]